MWRDTGRDKRFACAQLKNERPRRSHPKYMPNPTPEQILENAPKRTREVKVEANVVAYFGDLFIAWKEAITAIAKSKI